jgi:hypothetical protein
MARESAAMTIINGASVQSRTVGEDCAPPSAFRRRSDSTTRHWFHRHATMRRRCKWDTARAARTRQVGGTDERTPRPEVPARSESAELRWSAGRTQF